MARKAAESLALAAADQAGNIRSLYPHGVQAMRARHPYELIDGMTGAIVCIYKALSIAIRDAEAKNAKLGERRYYVRRATT